MMRKGIIVLLAGLLLVSPFCVLPALAYNAPAGTNMHLADGAFGKKTVIFEVDDLQAGWLESTGIDLIDLHIKERMPVVLGVVPDHLDNKSYGPGYLKTNLVDIYRNYSGLIEIAQHGWTHNSTEQMENLSYGEQEAVVENGLGIFKSLGIRPVTFTPPYGDANEDTVKILENNGFNSLILYGPDKTLCNDTNGSKLMVINSWTRLVNDSGHMKSAVQLMKDIDGSDSNVTFVLYHVQDFAQGSGNSIAGLGEIMEALKNSSKYQFMTANGYYNVLLGDDTAPATIKAQHELPVPQTSNTLSLFQALAIVFIVLSSAVLLYFGLWRRK